MVRERKEGRGRKKEEKRKGKKRMERGRKEERKKDSKVRKEGRKRKREGERKEGRKEGWKERRLLSKKEDNSCGVCPFARNWVGNFILYPTNSHHAAERLGLFPLPRE